MSTRRVLVTTLMCLGLAVLTVVLVMWFRRGPQSTPPAALTRLTVQFGWIPDTHHSGFWIAKERGFFAEEGLDVQLLPGGADSSPAKAVLSGVADIGQASGPEQLISARAEGLPIRGFAVFHRSSPHAIISTSRSPIRTLDDLRGKRVAVAFGDTAETMLRAALASRPDLDGKVELVPFRFDLTPLISGQVDAITGFKTDQPFTLKAKGLDPVILDYSTNGNIRSYGYLFFASETTIRDKRPQLEAFVRATRRGWEYAFAHPDEAVATMVKAVPGALDPTVETQKLVAVKQLMVDVDGQLAPWSVDGSVIDEVIQRMVIQGILKRAPDANQLFSPIP